jgi:hypothetical protein
MITVALQQFTADGSEQERGSHGSLDTVTECPFQQSAGTHDA